MGKAVLLLLFHTVSTSLGLPPALLSSLCHVESSHNIKALNLADGKGDSLGVCQIKLETARLVGFDGTAEELMVPETNIYYAGAYLRKQLSRYNNDITKAIASYNSGKYKESRVRAGPVNLDYVNKVIHQWPVSKKEESMIQLVPKKTFPVSINSEKWIVQLYTEKSFKKLSPGNIALTVYNHRKKYALIREIKFSPSGATRSTIAHELMHAFLSYRDFSHSSYGKMEEQICDVYGSNHKRMNELVNKIYKELHKK